MPQSITIYHHDGQTSQHVFEEGVSTFAGHGSNCEIGLSGTDVESIHCMFTCEAGDLKVQDWNTNGKTMLNGQTLSDESRFGAADELCIGANRIVLGADQATDSDVPPVAENKSENDADVDLQLELAQLRSSNSAIADEFNSSQPADDNSDSWFDDSFANGDTELLRSEVEHLQLELAERDQQILELQHSDDANGGSSDDTRMDDTARLVTRMESLLDELQTADERLRTFEELLRCSDDATQAEQEERRQLESWVDQIEQRVAAREDDSKAEIERLNGRLHDFKIQQKHNEQVLERALATRRSNPAVDGKEHELADSLQAQVQELQESRLGYQAEIEQLQAKCSQAADPDCNPAAVAELQQRVMEMEIEISRSRAEVARERAELARLTTELEQNSKTPGDASDSDVRLRAMREHLRELHCEEELEREARKQRGLGGRIAGLFRRIEER